MKKTTLLLLAAIALAGCATNGTSPLFGGAQFGDDGRFTGGFIGFGSAPAVAKTLPKATGLKK